jgi:hypothetical protein
MALRKVPSDLPSLVISWQKEAKKRRNNEPSTPFMDRPLKIRNTKLKFQPKTTGVDFDCLNN